MTANKSLPIGARSLLAHINSPEDVKKLNVEQLKQLAKEIRQM